MRSLKNRKSQNIIKFDAKKQLHQIMNQILADQVILTSKTNFTKNLQSISCQSYYILQVLTELSTNVLTTVSKNAS